MSGRGPWGDLASASEQAVPPESIDDFLPNDNGTVLALRTPSG